MAELLKLHIGQVLKHVLDLEPVLVEDYDSSDDETENELEPQSDLDHELDGDQSGVTHPYNLVAGRLGGSQPNGSQAPSGPNGVGAQEGGRRQTELSDKKKRKLKHSKKRRGRDPYGEDLLDFSGPKLMHGAGSLLFFHQLIGQLNWIGLPLWISIIYKILLFAFAFYFSAYKIVIRFYQMNIINQDYRNPIFIFISFLGFTTCASQIVFSFKTNLFDLCPLYKVLTTPKLCFIKTGVQHLLGSRSLGLLLMYLLFNGTMSCMLMSENLSDFINDFYLPTYLAVVFATSVSIFNLLGISVIDLYIRSSFGHWLLALKSHLENRFTHFHRRQRKLRHQQLLHLHNRRLSLQPQDCIANSVSPGDASIVTTCDTISYTSSNSTDRHLSFITLDEIQRNLNNMDDHLEVLRSVQIGSLVHITLNAFLSNGSLFLLAYHILANRSNSYHGFIVLLTSVSFIILIFLCYSGDRWVFYALSSFVQTVEDEYFMQSDMKLVGGSTQLSRASAIATLDPIGSLGSLNQDDNSEASSYQHQQQVAAHQSLLIKKKDVLFCREFLHQFENHLATPWTKLTVKSHLHMLRTFVTLIAAQIIFDHEH